MISATAVVQMSVVISKQSNSRLVGDNKLPPI